MGTLIVTQLPALVEPQRTPFAGSVIEALEKVWPDGGRGRVIHAWLGGRKLDVSCEAIERGGHDFEAKVGEDDTLVLAATPAGLDIPIWVIVAAVAAVAGVAATLLLAPAISNLPGSQKSPSAVYSVGATANEARLGGIIPRPYGRVVRTPEYASQSYRVFERNQETRFFLLCVGAGSHAIDDIRLGELSSAELSPGTVSWQAFRPADHGGVYGAVRAATGIHENVVTSAEVDRQELRSRLKYYAEDGTLTRSAGGFVIGPAEAADEVSVGDVVRFVQGLSSQERTVIAVSDGNVTFDGDFSVTGSGQVIVFGFDSVQVGPMVSSPAGALVDRIEVDIEFPRGLYKTNRETGDLRRQGVTFRIDILDLQADGTPFPDGRGRAFTWTEYGSTNTPQRRTYGWDLPIGRYHVKLVRLANPGGDTTDASVAQQTLWTGLRGFVVDPPAGTPAYGDVTLVAITLTGTEQLSQGAQQQISVVSRSDLASVENGAVGPSSAHGDVINDILRDPIHGGGLGSGLINAQALADPRFAQLAPSGFNGVFDTEITVWDAIKTVAALAYGEPVIGEAGLEVVFDAPSPRVQIVTSDALRAPAKMVASWLKTGDPDGVEIDWLDPKDFSKRQTRWPESSVRPRRETRIGLTDEDEALAHARYAWAARQKRNVSIELPMEWAPLVLRKFDRIGVALPEFDWGQGGHVRAVSGLSVRLSCPVPAGTVWVSFRGQDGRELGPYAATGDGDRSLVLAQAPLEPLVEAGALPTLAAVSATQDTLVQDMTISSARASAQGITLVAVTYDETVFNERGIGLGPVVPPFVM